MSSHVILDVESDDWKRGIDDVRRSNPCANESSGCRKRHVPEQESRGSEMLRETEILCSESMSELSTKSSL